MGWAMRVTAACQAVAKPAQTWTPMDSLPRASFTTTCPVARWMPSASNQAPIRSMPPAPSCRSSARSQSRLRVG